METKPNERFDGSHRHVDVLDDRDESPWEHVHERPIAPEQWSDTRHDGRDAVLRSVRRRGSYLFVRYALEGGGPG